MCVRACARVCSESIIIHTFTIASLTSCSQRERERERTSTVHAFPEAKY